MAPRNRNSRNANGPRRASRKMSINMSFNLSLRSSEALDSELETIFYGLNDESNQGEEQNSTSFTRAFGFEDSMNLIKCAPVGSTVTVNRDFTEGIAEEGNDTKVTYIVETKNGESGSHHSTRNMSINLSFRSRDALSTEFQELISQLYEEQDNVGEELKQGVATTSGIPNFGITDSLTLVKCRPYTGKLSPHFETWSEEEDSSKPYVVVTKAA